MRMRTLALGGTGLAGLALAGALAASALASPADAVPKDLKQQFASTGHVTYTQQTTIEVQRGVVVSDGPNGLEVKSKDGFEQTYLLSPKLKRRTFPVGEQVRVRGVQTQKGWVARRVVVLHRRRGSRAAATTTT